jgi:hypothetical protein
VFGWGLRGRYERARIRIRQRSQDAGAWARLRGRPRSEVPVVVSLTTTSERIGNLPAVIDRLLGQTVRPHKILLWLSVEPYLFDEGIAPTTVPRALWRLTGERFEIRYTANTGPYRKIIPSLAETQPRGLCVATIDDDHRVPADWLERLYAAHLQRPDDVICYFARRILRRSDGALETYSEWPMWEEAGTYRDLLPIGFGGVLYPPSSLASGVQDKGTFTRLAPRTDDLWLRLFSCAAGARVTLIPPRTYVALRAGSQELFEDNHPSGNDEAITRLVDWSPDAFVVSAVSPSDQP